MDDVVGDAAQQGADAADAAGTADMRNAAAEGDAEIGAGEAVVRTLVVEAREDLEIARQVRAALAAQPG